MLDYEGASVLRGKGVALRSEGRRSENVGQGNRNGNSLVVYKRLTLQGYCYQQVCTYESDCSTKKETFSWTEHEWVLFQVVETGFDDYQWGVLPTALRTERFPSCISCPTKCDMARSLKAAARDEKGGGGYLSFRKRTSLTLISELVL